MGAQAVIQGAGGSVGERGDAGSGAEDSNGETGGPGGRTVALDGGIVDSGSAARILDRQPGAQADVMETRAEDGEAGVGTGSSVVEPGA